MAHLQIKIYVHNAVNLEVENGELLQTYGEEKLLLVIYIFINASEINLLLLKKFKFRRQHYKIDIIK